MLLSAWLKIDCVKALNNEGLYILLASKHNQLLNSTSYCSGSGVSHKQLYVFMVVTQNLTICVFFSPLCFLFVVLVWCSWSVWLFELSGHHDIFECRKGFKASTSLSLRHLLIKIVQVDKPFKCYSSNYIVS